MGLGATLSLCALTLAQTQGAGPERLATTAFAAARDPSGQKPAAAVGAVLAERVAKHARLRLLEPGRVLSGDPRTREEETLARARTALADGRRAYDALSLDEAIARLGQAVALYQQTGPLLGDLAELETSLMHLGAALTLRGSSDEGVSTFLELLTLDPSYSPEGFPPSVMKIFDKAVERLAAQPRGGLEVYSTPPYAAVYIDGVFRGVTPLTLSDVGAGTHYLRLEQNGFVTHGAPIEVTPNQRITSQTRLVSVKSGAELRDLLSRASREVLAEGMGNNLRSLGRLLVADVLILVSVSQSGQDVTLTGAAFDAGGATRVATERAVIGAESSTFLRDTGAMIDKLLAAAAGQPVASDAGSGAAAGAGGAGFGLASGGGVTGGSGAAGGGSSPPVDATRLNVDASPPAGTVVGWLMVGLGGVAVGGGVIFAILAKVTHSDYLETSQASPDLGNIRDTGKTQALVADLGLFGGAALIAGGALTLILTAKKTSAPDVLGMTPGLAPLDGGAMVTLGGAL
ncbi:MAG: PEGA domain-containing protein [Deltaproteobacteria bacterium]|nr:PEGA domain-containing protein [Deltaproteobacteria bacterium]